MEQRLCCRIQSIEEMGLEEWGGGGVGGWIGEVEGVGRGVSDQSC